MASSRTDYLTLAVRKILRPIVRILIRAGLRYDDFCDVAKVVYVESAIRDGLGMPGEKTPARIAFATGVTRSDVVRFVRESSKPQEIKPTFAAALTEILNRWHTDPEFTGPYGIPLDIGFERPEGRCFVDLAYHADPKAPPGILLQELLDSGVVQRVGDEHLKVLSRTFVVADVMSPVMLEYFGNAVTDLATTIQHNMSAEKADKRLERSVFADHGLTPSQLPAFENFARARVQQLIVDVDNWLSTDGKRLDTREVEPVLDVGINIFQYVRAREPEGPLDLPDVDRDGSL